MDNGGYMFLNNEPLRDSLGRWGMSAIIIHSALQVIAFVIIPINNITNTPDDNVW